MFLKQAIGARAREILIDLLRIADLGVIALSGLGTFYLRHGELTLSPLQVGVLVTTLVLMSYSLHLASAYKPARALNILAALRTISGAVSWTTLALLALGYATKTSVEISRLWMGSWLAGTVPLLLILRIGLRLWLDHSGASIRLRRRIALIGASPLLAQMEERIACNGHHLDMVLSVDIGNNSASLAAAIQAIDDASQNLDSIVVAVPGSRIEDISNIVAGIRHHWANIELCVEQAFIDLPFAESHSIAGVPILQLVRRPMEGWAGIVKWLEDKILGLVFIMAALPLMAVIAILIRLDSPGPALFRQKRFGFSGREFTLYKFRTMVRGAEDAPVHQATRNDARVTRLGRFLRRSSLDELPQLFNVLNGTMSLVGPRPHAVPHDQHYAPRIDHYLARHRIKPGLTGWAQVHGLRGETATLEAMRERVAHDIFYIENWSPGLDMIILLRTVVACLGGRNAY